MEIKGTREGTSWWKGTSTRELMKSEADFWKYASKDLNYVDSYFVPIQFDQRYPDLRQQKFDADDSEDEKNEEPVKVEKTEQIFEKVKGDEANKAPPKVDRIRKRRCWCPFKSLPFCGKSVNYKSTEYIMTYEFGDKEKLPTIVLIHGYAGSALTFYPLFKYLNGKQCDLTQYHVIVIDMLGMGCSSRPEFLASSTKEAWMFFVESLELWRQEMKLDKMTLVWHSLGAYVGAKYASRYPENINNLALLSPLGVERDIQGTSEALRRADTMAKCTRKYPFLVAKWLLNNHKSPLDVLRVLGFKLSTLMINDYVGRRLHLDEFASGIVVPFFIQTLLWKKSGELAIGRIIDATVSAYEPTFNDLLSAREKGTKIVIAFGENDFTNTTFTETTVADQLLAEGFDVTIIPDSTHQVYFDKPDLCCEVINKLNIA